MKTQLVRNTSRAVLGLSVLSCAVATAEWTTREIDGRVEAAHDGNLGFAWQKEPLTDPKGGEKFAASAFLHPLRTPSGFEWTTIQPSDHLHHFGVWWPWKYIEVDEKKYNCWEIQEGQGAQVASGMKRLPSPANRLEWEFFSVVELKAPDTPPRPVIHESARIGLSMDGGDTQVVDILLRQKALEAEVTIVNYRYSGFSWRGPLSWDRTNSVMTTSAGKTRDEANGEPARWVMVSGPTPKGKATVLLMSAAIKIAGVEECLRVWDGKNHNGTPFVNFNPVMKHPIPLNDARPAVSHRRYRIIAADRLIDAEAAEKEWRKWAER